VPGNRGNGRLRSAEWFERRDLDGFLHRSWLKSTGVTDEAFRGRPVIGICNSWSELVNCNVHLRGLAESVKRGVFQAGGFPVEFPVLSLGESLMKPTTMLYRNLMAMDVEESIRSYPLDGVVLLTGCDKTNPASIMGAASADIPSIVVTGGPMLNGHWRGVEIGSCSDCWHYHEELRAGRISEADWVEIENSMSRSNGHCMTMGTASTMASMVESLGVSLPGNAAIPAVDAQRYRLAQLSGRRIVEMVREDLVLSRILTRKAFENAIKANAAIGGSTNSVVHLLAIAGRIGVELELEDWDKLGSQLPCLLDLQPSGRFLMEDFYYAGGLPAVLREISSVLNKDALTVNGKTMGENIANAPCWNRAVIKEFADPFKANAGIAILRGNLAPDGAVIKPSAATPKLLKHRGKAVVFETIEEFKAKIDDPNLDIDENSIMVLKGCGPKGYPGMAEVGNMALPPKILKKGITDMVRISDARMSGTAYGTVVLHVAPEAAAGGPLALVRTGDVIELDVPARKLHLDVSDEELAKRRAAWVAPEPPKRGYYKLYVEHVQQADKGADLDFLVGGSGTTVTRDSH